MAIRASGVLSLALLGIALTAHARAIPRAPEYAVLDETGALPAGIQAALERLLTEHDHVSDEQIVLAAFGSAEGEDPGAFTRRVFDEWKVGNRGKDNGVLLALFIKERRASIMA